MSEEVKKIMILDKRFGMVEGLMLLETKQNAYIFPIEHLTSRFSFIKKRAIYNLKTKFQKISVNQLPGLTVLIQCPELYGKDIYIGLTLEGMNIKSFFSKKVKGVKKDYAKM